ncbi:hypothetical protein TH61_06810 [Rufibacter sp. DG15C]|uniref:isoaspartyl peptidase/L-asparaginase family protein n=1 Tax=Rufibacter sp. DG15C TaxID=1379909 RepID=UPI00078C54B9|nr:isoaspartyl peptidase/L-asparaginase [Rufibacter sp. DG15C]AMM50948.1 hypothetical protein TH61_06810 [Rufibacter sp. DG15C]
MKKFAIAIHAGAENMKKSEVSPEKEKAYRDGLSEALNAGWRVLKKGGTAVDAVETAVRSLEDNPLFNAGKGAALTELGENKMDAAIMDGKDMNAGACSNVQQVKNPISLARAIMEKTKHVYLTSDGAMDFAREQELTLKPIPYFQEEERIKEWEKQHEKEKKKPEARAKLRVDTVGAVALDQDGNLAAATSTGGLTNQMNGRVGDSPIIGAGTYANSEVVAVSCTGEGEEIMRSVLAHEVYALMKYKGLSVQEAVDEAVDMYKKKIGGDKGIIAMDPNGEVGMVYNCNLMFRGFRQGGDDPVVRIWED